MPVGIRFTRRARASFFSTLFALSACTYIYIYTLFLDVSNLIFFQSGSLSPREITAQAREGAARRVFFALFA